MTSVPTPSLLFLCIILDINQIIKSGEGLGQRLGNEAVYSEPVTSVRDVPPLYGVIFFLVQKIGPSCITARTRCNLSVLALYAH